MSLRPPSSPLFPYTTLFRSRLEHRDQRRVVAAEQVLPLLVRQQHLRLETQARKVFRDFDPRRAPFRPQDRKSTRLNSSHRTISYAVFCLKKKNIKWYE